jgi:hypothetical protein
MSGRAAVSHNTYDEYDAPAEVLVSNKAAPGPEPDMAESPWTLAPARQKVLASGKDGEGDDVPTEMIFNLFNRGSGWGEEIIPHVTVEKRKITKKVPKRSKQV